MAKNNVYVGQPLNFNLDTETDLTDATAAIRYKDPDGTTGYLPGDTTEQTRILASMTGAQLAKTGQWEFRSWVTFDGADAATPGRPVLVRVEGV
jgi:hypothetical protein